MRRPCSGLRSPAILIPRLRMHFAEFLSWGFPAHLKILSLPTCVGLRYGHVGLTRGFSWQGVRRLRLPRGGFSLARLLSLTCSARSSNRARVVLPASPCASNGLPWGWTLRQLSFRLRSALRLRPRLSPGRRALPGRPWAFGGADSCRPFRYSYRHSRCPPLRVSLRSRFKAAGTLPYPALLPPRLRFRA